MSIINEEKFDLVIEDIHIPQDPPFLTLIIGPCRAGTTALSNVFARTGHEAYMQPIKSMRRSLEEDTAKVSWTISNKNDLIVSKETLGPNTRAEFFNPVKVLLKAGYPADKLHVITIMREPLATLTSWTWMWDKVSLEGFIAAYNLTSQIRKNVRENGIAHTTYVHDVIRKRKSSRVIKRLFERINPKLLIYSENLTNWTSGPTFGKDEYNVGFFDEPPPRFIKGVQDWGGYQYKKLTPDLPEEQVNALKNAGVIDLFREFVKACEEELGFKVHL
jgi:hypothetical protein